VAAGLREDLLGRRVGRRTDELALPGQRDRILRRILAQSKIGEKRLRAACFFGHDDVSGLDVTVDQSLGVRAVERITDLAKDRQTLLEAHRPVPGEHRSEVCTTYVLHGVEQRPIGRRACLEQLEDMRVIERLRVRSLAPEPCGKARIAGRHSRGQDLQGAQTALRPLGEIYGAHPALAEHRLDPVPRDLTADLTGTIGDDAFHHATSMRRRASCAS
jgi:hypothetical protein